ncbi:MAG: FkbM family methyltransferase [Gemmatimonas sp.]
MLIDYKTCRDVVAAFHKVDITKVLHIGAHTGEEAEAYAANGVRQVIWVEANPALLTDLERHIRRFPLMQQIVPLALWNENTRLTFNVTNNNESSSLFELGTHADHYPHILVVDRVEVDAVRFDSIIESQTDTLLFTDFEFVNIDTQGAELAILQGFGRHLAAPSIKAIYLEVNRESLYRDIPLVDEIDVFLGTRGFSRVMTQWTNVGWGDALYLRHVEGAACD